MYNLHTAPDIYGEMQTHSRGRLVKARLPDRAAPNVSWYWFPVGNCLICKHYQPPMPRQPVKCLSPKIPQEEFQRVYLYTNTCPEFAAGMHPSSLKDDVRAQMELDVMRAVGLAEGEPEQRVEVIIDQPWSIGLAQRAHWEQSQFLLMAGVADYVARGGVNDPATAWSGGYTDLSSDLEEEWARREANNPAPAGALEEEPDGDAAPEAPTE